MAAKGFFGVEERRAGKNSRGVIVVHVFDDSIARDAWVNRRVKRNKDYMAEVSVKRRAVDKAEARRLIDASSARSGFGGSVVKHSFFNPKTGAKERSDA